jgi:sugar phosphate isomerase/epimerase
MRGQRRSSVSRRGFIRNGFAGAALILGGSRAIAAEAAPQERPMNAEGRRGGRGRTMIGLQLYSVRGECEKDLPRVIEAVAKMGYRGVEFAGYYGRGAKDLRTLLDQNGIVCCGTHTAMDTLLGDQLKATIEFNKILGNPNLIVPWLADNYRASRQAWLDTAKLFNELAEKVKPEGMRVGYHNHNVEFTPVDGELPWDVFMKNTSPDVVMQLDTGNALSGGADPLPFLYKYPNRAITVHLKEFSKKNDKALIGEGDINWRAFFALCRAVGGTQWYIVEQESYAYPPLECVKRCLDNLRGMRMM